MLVPLNINLPVPAPSLIKLLAVVLVPVMALETKIEPALVTPNVIPEVLVIPIVFIVKVLVALVASVFTLVADCVVNPPVKVAAAEVPINLIAPPLLIPEPSKLNDSGIVKALVPLIWIAAPLPTIVPWDPDKVPNASLLAIWITPAVTEVVPA